MMKLQGIYLQRIRNFLIQSATLFGVGKFPKAPGTWGTLATLPLAWILMQAGPLLYMTVVILLLPVAILSAELYEQFSGSHDSKEIVIDELIGFLITMTWLPMGWQSFIFGFLLFRLLDIWKPYPISYLDKKIQGGLGVVIDDVAAGIVANMILQLVYSKTMWLGSQAIVTAGG
jgi:phosphatidylglycerophosphatase A